MEIKCAYTELVDVSKLVPNPKNNNKHPKNQIERLAKIIDFQGQRAPIVVSKRSGFIVKGHGRLEAIKLLGWEKCAVDYQDYESEAQEYADMTADNQIATWAEFDTQALLDELPNLDIDTDMLGMVEIPEIETEENEVVEDEVPEEVETRCKRGDIWKLGEHRLMCGDSTCITDVEKLMDGQKADMVFTDPPYGMKKESDGVLNDNLNYDDLLEFNKKWIPISFANTKENGSWYCWGIDEPLMDIYSNILKPMQKANKITFRNLLTWKKENDNPTMLFNGACSSTNRSYYTNEKCLFVMCGVQGFNNNSDYYDETFEPIRSYLEKEAKKVGLNSSLLKDICGVGMWAHWFTKSQFVIIPENHYKKLQDYYKEKAFCLSYNDLRLLFDDKKHKTLRAFFDGTQDQCIDVWVSDVTSQKERELTGGHATPKPIKLCCRAIKASSKNDEIVLDLFGGSGSTLIACEQLNRKCFMMEMDEHYCDVIIQRWENLTGKTAERIADENN